MDHYHEGNLVDHAGMSDEELDRCRREAELEQLQRRQRQQGLQEIGLAIQKHLAGTSSGYCSLGVREIGRLAVEAIPLDPEDDEDSDEEES